MFSLTSKPAKQKDKLNYNISKNIIKPAIFDIFGQSARSRISNKHCKSLGFQEYAIRCPVPFSIFFNEFL